MDNSDTNFDQLFERFSEKIYGGLKGQIREKLILSQLDQHLSISANMSVADVGGGLGQMSRWFAQHQCHVDYFDLSERMLKYASAQLAEHKHNIRFYSGPFQQTLSKQYDLLHCQAVLEWLHDPQAGLKKLCAHVKPGGSLILMFFNRNSVILRNLVRGNLNAASGTIGGNGSSLTPISPLEPSEVFEQLRQLGFTLHHHFGIRCFTDLQDKQTQARLGFDSLYEHERKYCEQEPFRSLARYIGVIASKH